MSNNELLFRLLDSTKLIESSFTPAQAAKLPELIKESYFLFGRRNTNHQMLSPAKLAILSLGDYLFSSEERASTMLNDIKLFDDFLRFLRQNIEISNRENSLFLNDHIENYAKHKIKEFLEENFDAKQIKLQNIVKDRCYIDKTLLDEGNKKFKTFKKLIAIVLGNKISA